MAKRKAVENFEQESIEFELEGVRYRIIHLDTAKMTVELRALSSNEPRTLPFAHLPKALKKKIRPL